MKKIFSTSKLMIVLVLILLGISSAFISYAAMVEQTIPFSYNVLPTIKKGSAIDKNATPTLKFELYEDVDAIYYHEKLLEVNDKTFEIDISDLKGKSTITFTDKDGQTSSFIYYISDENGKIEGYELVKDTKLNVYVTTYKGIQIIYTNKEENVIEKLKSYIDLLPENMIRNVKLIKLIPYTNTSNVAGVTKDSTITLYKFSKYAKATQKQILFHEIAHTFANRLMIQKDIDYSYTTYQEMAKKDGKYASHYAKTYAEENNRYSEDFADSVAFYFMDTSFAKNYPNRASYIKELLEK